MKKFGLWLVILLTLIWGITGISLASQEKNEDDEWIVTPTMEVRDESPAGKSASPRNPGEESRARDPIDSTGQTITQDTPQDAIKDAPRNRLDKAAKTGEQGKMSAEPAVILRCGGSDYRVQNFVRNESSDAKDTAGSIYVSIDDPGFHKFLKSTGAFYTWSSQKDVLFISSSGRDLYFGDGFSRMKFKSQGAESKRGFINRENITYLPLDELLNYMGLICASSTSGGDIICQLNPTIDDIYVKENAGVRQLLIHTSIPVNYSVEAEDSSRIRLLFPRTTWGMRDFKGSVGEFEVSYDKEKEDLRLEIKFPRLWVGRLQSRMSSGDISLELMPDFPLIAGYKAETMDKILFTQRDGSYALKFCASGPIHYFWSLDRETRILTIDFPLVTGDAALAIPTADRNYVSELALCSFASGYGATRLSIHLTDAVGFDFATATDDPYSLTIRFSKGISLASCANNGNGNTSLPEVWGTIVIDPGHGGCDPGACNAGMGLKEKDLTLDMALRLAQFLKSMGWKVVLTRTSDRDVSWAHSPDKVELQSRADVANINGADAFISIHCNASVSSSLNGSSVHWCKQEDLPLAQSLKGLIANALGIVDKGLHQDGFYVLRHTKMPAILIETAFVSHAGDAMKLAQGQYRAQIARAIAGGLNSFMSGRFAKRKSPVSGTLSSEENMRGSSGSAGARLKE